MNESNYAFFNNLRSAAILTNSYVAADVLGPTTDTNQVQADVSRYNQLNIFVEFTIGSLTDADLKVEFSHDGTTYFQDSAIGSPSSGESAVSALHYTFSADGNYTISIPIKCNYIKISIVGNGTVTSSEAAIHAALGVV